MTAAEARALGNATTDQRAELRELIRSKAVADAWVQRFYRGIRASKQGLSRGQANLALIYLRSLPDKTDQPTYATADQGKALRGLIRTHQVPGTIAQLFLTRLDDRQLTYVEADRAAKEWRRLPLRPFVAPHVSRPGAPGDVADGYYALAGSDNRVRRYRVFTHAGRQLVDQITGDQRHQRRRMRGRDATTVLRAVGADVAAAARRFGAAFKRCSDCNQPIGDPAQPGYPHGYGPDCWRARQDVAAAAESITATPTEVDLEGIPHVHRN